MSEQTNERETWATCPACGGNGLRCGFKAGLRCDLCYGEKQVPAWLAQTHAVMSRPVDKPRYRRGGVRKRFVPRVRRRRFR